MDTSVAGFKEEPRRQCEGHIDALNGRAPDPSTNTVAGAMQVRGWTTISGRDGIVPDKVFVRLQDRSGKPFYVRARAIARDDFKGFFGQPNLADPGFLANIDTSRLGGEYSLSVARLYRGTLERCEQLAFPVTVDH